MTNGSLRRKPQTKKSTRPANRVKGIRVNELAITLPDGAQVRKTSDGAMSVFDLLKVAGAVNPRKTWERLGATYPEVVADCYNLKFSGSGQRHTPVTDTAGWRRILTVLPGVLGKAYREAANALVDLHLENPEALATLELERLDEAALARMEMRARTKRSNKRVNREIAARGGDKDTHRTVANQNNVAVTGKVARELKLARRVKHTRDGMTTLELSLIAAAEELEAEAMERRGVYGEGQILATVQEVAGDIAALRSKYTGALDYPSGGLLTVPV